MNKKALIFLVLSLLAMPGFSEEVKKPVVAGAFYPASPVVLAGQVDKYLREANPQQIDGEIIALISPHAGYVYSGPVAAYGYKTISNKKYDTVIIIGPSHHVAFDGVSILDKGFYETPLGKVEIDSELAMKLMKSKKGLIYFQPQAYEEEHSVEVQIPFLQRALKDFKIVTLIMGTPNYKTCTDLSEALVTAIRQSGKRSLIIASTDLSHYYSYNDAVLKDRITLSELLNFDAERLAEKISNGECELCGVAPVLTTLMASKKLGANRIMVLKYANSGDTAGDKSRVVGYGCLAIYREEEKMLNAEQKKKLLTIARKTIEDYVKERKKPEFKEADPELLKEKGAFVTLHKGKDLRGCIGNIIGHGPLYLTVRDMAIASATEDPRFPPLTPNELKDIKIEISVLSEPKKVTDINEIKLGVHGVIVKRGFASGVFLPQVALETGWTKEEFLSNLCSHKAGLPPNAWKDKNTEIYIFSAQVFEEGA
ncbi:MAG: AmmeMemoRadiSam system protein B [Candidatus Omnitrophota bacterium]